MSLDIYMCQIMPPEDANSVFWVTEGGGGMGGGIYPDFYPRLEKIQKTGCIPVKATRIGRNCLNSEWHALHQAACVTHAHDEDHHRQEMIIVFPGEAHEKVIQFLDIDPKNQGPAPFWNGWGNEFWNFLFICW